MLIFQLDFDLEESGWKAIHSDVFRPPKRLSWLLPPMIGSGIQFLCVFMVIARESLRNRTFSSLRCTYYERLVRGLSHTTPISYQTGVVSLGVLLFLVLGIFAGFYSGKFFNVVMSIETARTISWRRNAVYTATIFPSVIFGLFFVLNFFLWGERSSAAIPVGTFLLFVFLWFCVSLPLIYIGAFFARERTYEPVRPFNYIARPEPEQPWYLKLIPR